MTRFFFEDFTSGWTKTLGPLLVSDDDIIAFAREFDPQVFHLDEEAAKSTLAGGLIASGWHTCSLNMRLLAEGFLLDTASMGAPGIDEVKWVRPVAPGDSLVSKVTVLESRASKSRPDLGLVRFGFEMLNQQEKIVMTQTNWVIIGRRDAPLPEGGGSGDRTGGGAASSSAAQPSDAAHGENKAVSYLEDLNPGDTQKLGSFTFTTDAIIRFARQFDPQRFHVDPVAAKESLFGGLCASGWHTAAVWMKLLVAHRTGLIAELRRRGERPAQLGPSPGFKNLKWSKPVYADDTLTYWTTVVGTRPSGSRPGWGFASHRNSGVNQHGEEVFSFDGTVLWERRPGA
jgi:acyl dehydratase